MRKECGLRVFENRVLRRIFGPKGNEVTGDWIRLYNKELYAVYSSQKYFSGDQVKKTEMGRTCSTYGKRRGAYRILVRKHDEMRPL
jgi:hypothetical protein